MHITVANNYNGGITKICVKSSIELINLVTAGRIITADQLRITAGKLVTANQLCVTAGHPVTAGRLVTADQLLIIADQLCVTCAGHLVIIAN